MKQNGNISENRLLSLRIVESHIRLDAQSHGSSTSFCSEPCGLLHSLMNLPSSSQYWTNDKTSASLGINKRIYISLDKFE